MYLRDKKVCLLITIGAFIFLSSCVHKKFVQSDLWGVAYDGNGQPLPEVQIIRDDGEIAAISDIEGEFLIKGLKYGSHVFYIKREGFESINIEVNFTNRTQIFYVNMVNYFQLRNLLNKAILNEKWDSCIELLDRMQQLENANTKEITYYLAVVEFKRKNYKESIEYLTQLINWDPSDVYSYLLLSDIYQYRLQNKSEALKNLHQILTRSALLSEDLIATVNKRIFDLSENQ